MEVEIIEALIKQKSDLRYSSFIGGFVQIYENKMNI